MKLLFYFFYLFLSSSPSLWIFLSKPHHFLLFLFFTQHFFLLLLQLLTVLSFCFHLFLIFKKAFEKNCLVWIFINTPEVQRKRAFHKMKPPRRLRLLPVLRSASPNYHLVFLLCFQILTNFLSFTNAINETKQPKEYTNEFAVHIKHDKHHDPHLVAQELAKEYGFQYHGQVSFNCLL